MTTISEIITSSTLNLKCILSLHKLISNFKVQKTGEFSSLIILSEKIRKWIFDIFLKEDFFGNFIKKY